MTHDWHRPFDRDGYRVNARYVDSTQETCLRHYFEYQFFVGGKLLAEGADFSPGPHSVDPLDAGRMTESAAVELMGFFAQDADTLRDWREEGSGWVTDALIEWAETGGYDDLSLLVNDYEQENV